MRNSCNKWLLLLLPFCLQAATITGKVQDQMNKQVIADALIILQKPGDEKFYRTTVSDQKGDFILTNVAPGTYHIEVAHSGYFKNVLFDMKIESDRTYTVTVKLLKMEGKSTSEYCFMLGGIEVCSVERELIPETPVTSRKVDTGEIDHMQATSLGDILSLVPGIEKTNNPGLAKPSQVGIRSIYVASSSFDPIESFGAAIVVDGNQLSTNANATTKIYGSTGYQGLDLRTIPAENVKSVEVISGIPSVEYGNFGNGIIKVETKIGQIAPKLNAKINPDTKSANFSHGLRLGKTTLDYNLNYGYSERDLRKIGDEFQRLYLSSNLTRNFLNEKLVTRLNGTFTKLIDDEQPTDVNKIKNYNRGYLATANYSFDYKPNSSELYKGFIGVNLNRKKAFKEKWVAEPYLWYKDTTVVDTIITQSDTTFQPRDTSLLVIDPGYVGKMKEIGREWQFTTKLQRKLNLIRRHSSHEILLGIEYNYEKNTGEGLVIDSKYPYYGQYSSHRSYAFDDYPSLHSLSLYAEDQLSSRFLGHKFNLMLGLRYDAFNSPSQDSLRSSGNLLYKPNHGQFLSPRLNFQYFLSEAVRLRIGAGKSVKAVSLGYIFRPPAYYKYLDEHGNTIEEMQIQYNPNLKAYSIDKYEASLDWKIGNYVGTSLTGYYSQSFNMPTVVDYPWGYSQNPDTITDADYGIYENLGWKKSNGIELILRTNRIKNFQYRMNVTYRFEKSGRTGLTYDTGPDTAFGETVWYKPPYSWSEKVIIDYQVNYISNRLGIWITLEAQQIPLENRKTIYQTELYTRVEDGVPRPWQQGMSYYYDRYLVSSGGRWLFNFRITKSLTTNAEVSLFVNNVLDDRAKWKNLQGLIYENNPPIFYGMEVSAQW